MNVLSHTEINEIKKYQMTNFALHFAYIKLASKQDTTFNS